MSVQFSYQTGEWPINFDKKPGPSSVLLSYWLIQFYELAEVYFLHSAINERAAILANCVTEWYGSRFIVSGKTG